MKNFFLQLAAIWLISVSLLPLFGVGIIFAGLFFTGLLLWAETVDEIETEEDSE